MAAVTKIIDLDILEKRRLACRKFGFVRHYVYRTKSLIEAPRETADYASDEDRHDKDAAKMLTAEHEARKKREASYRAFRHARKSYKEKKLVEDREKEWQKQRQHEHFLTVAPQYRNKGGMPYNFLTMEYESNFDGQKLKYREERAVWREGMRRVRLQSKMSGNRNYDILSWKKREQIKEPPEPPPFKHPPPPRPCTALPDPPKVPLVALDVPRPYSVIMPKKDDASKDYHWDMASYMFKPYKFK